MRNLLTLLLVIGLLVASSSPAAAQSGEGFEYVIQPGDTVFDLARRFGTSVRLIVGTNNLQNADLIFAGKTLIIPATALNPPAPSQPPASTRPATGGMPAAGAVAPGSFSVEVGVPIYSGDGHVVDIPITVHNHSVVPAIAGGKYTSKLLVPGVHEQVTLVKARHGQFEVPLVGEALLWQADVRLSDGSTHREAVGCRFLETVHAQGDEPLERDAQGNWLKAFHWEVRLFDGWFDCGNSWRINPENIPPGASGSSVLRAHLVNPHNFSVNGSVVGAPYPQRFVTGLDLTVFTPDGAVVGSQSVGVAAP